MKLRTISEIQHKFPTTNMDRTNVSGVYGVGSINDLYRKQSKRHKKPATPVPDGDIKPDKE